MLKIYDAHCHIFNVKILISLTRTPPDGDIRGIVDWWDWLAELTYGMFSSERANNKFILKSMKSRCQLPLPLGRGS